MVGFMEPKYQKRFGLVIVHPNHALTRWLMWLDPYRLFCLSNGPFFRCWSRYMGFHCADHDTWYTCIELFANRACFASLLFLHFRSGAFFIQIWTLKNKKRQTAHQTTPFTGDAFWRRLQRRVAGNCSLWHGSKNSKGGILLRQLLVTSRNQTPTATEYQYHHSKPNIIHVSVYVWLCIHHEILLYMKINSFCCVSSGVFLELCFSLQTKSFQTTRSKAAVLHSQKLT